MLVKHCCFWLGSTQEGFTLLWQNCQQKFKGLTVLGPHEVLGTPEGCFTPVLLELLLSDKADVLGGAAVLGKAEWVDARWLMLRGHS